MYMISNPFAVLAVMTLEVIVMEETKEFWGTTPVCNIYDVGVLLTFPHEYMNIDRESEAWKLLHQLFMHTLPFDPFHDTSDD